MKFQKSFPALCAALLIVIGYGEPSAAPLTPEQALERALSAEAVNSTAPGRRAVSTPGNLSLALTVTAPQTGQNALYVFSKENNGYLLVSADDRVEPLLGYSDSGAFNALDFPPAMKWWIEEYARQIGHAASSRTIAAAVERPDRDPVAPMVTTRWNQDSPYNALCPSYDGRRSMTGCVATAMAQIMAYHKWPAQGKGAHEYYYRNETISLDFSKITYDWGNMIDSYANGAGTERQRSAVAQLMYSCGVSTNMAYSPSQSGTADAYVPGALVDYFDYDAGIRYAERDYFGLLDWEEFIYEQLRDYGPVQYSGSSSDGGHSFVCDGYSSDGFFHINWGWGGMSDGYFRLSALDPASQGIGGSSSGFNYNQAVVANIRKPKKNSKMYLNLMMDQGFTVVPTKTVADTRPGDQLQVGGRIINYSIATATGSLGIRFTNNESGEVKYGTAPTRFSLQSLGFAGGYTSDIPSTLRAGSYTITPVMCGTDGVWKEIPVKLSTPQAVLMTIKNGICTFQEAPTGEISVENVEVLTPVYLGNLFRMSASITNPGETEYVGTITPTLASGNQPIAKASSIPVDILPGESMPLEYTGIFNHFATSELPSPGTYTLYLVSEATNQILSDGLEVELHGVPEQTVITASDFKILGDPEKADRDRLEFSANVTCQEGYFGRNLMLVIFPYSSGEVSALAYFSSNNLFVGSGESAELTASGAFAAGEPGKKYFAVLFDDQTQVSPRGEEVVFTIADNASIDELTIAEALSHARVYTVAGTLLREADIQNDPQEALDGLPTGLYIIEITDASGSRTVNKIAL